MNNRCNVTCVKEETMNQKYVCYYRVSTREQGRSGYGLEAQRKTIEDYLNGNGWQIVAEYTEIESGGNDDRPELLKALRDVRLIEGAKLIVSKLDRLSRDLGFITQLQKAGVSFVVAEMPDANELTINLLAAVAQHERKLISQRTREALARAKERGVKLGRAAHRHQRPGAFGDGDMTKATQARIQRADDLAKQVNDIIETMRTEGFTSLREIAEQLNARCIRTPSGKGRWQANTVKRVMDRASRLLL
jgi:DNA invertase Pin-like site-specific DNA recombinase